MTHAIPAKRFIPSQRLYLLEAEPTQRKKCLEPERFRMARQKEQDREEHTMYGMPDGCRWSVVDDRYSLLTDSLAYRRERKLPVEVDEPERLCLTIDAGVGKTTAINQAAYLRSSAGQLVILCSFAELPLSSADFFGTDAGTPWLAKQFRLGLRYRGQRHRVAANRVAQDLDTAAVLRCLKSQLRRGRVTLIVDALDEIGRDKDSDGRARSLQEFLLGHPEVRCLVAGRPFAITDRHWKTLFAPDGGETHWQFGQVDVFNQKEIKEFVGDERWAKLQELDATSLSIPRSLETALEMPIEKLNSVRTTSDLYWRCVENMLDKAFADPDFSDLKIDLERDEILKLFSLLAFEMTKAGNYSGVPEKDERGNKSFAKFRDAIWTNRWQELGYSSSSKNEKMGFTSTLKALGRLNEFIDFAVMDNAGLTQLYWRNRTLQAMFSALWITRYSTSEADRQWLPTNLYVRADESTADVYEFWRLASEMPIEASDPAVYVTSMSVLYVPDVDPWRTVRSTEMIYRSWERMLREADFLTGQLTLDEATFIAQQEAFRVMGWPMLLNRQSVLKEKPPREEVTWDPIQEPDIARKAVLAFLTEYPGLLGGERSVNPAARFARRSPKNIAWDNELGFRLCPLGYYAEQDRAKRKEKLKFVYGDAVNEASVPSPLFMHQYQLTNEFYELFDGQHFDEEKRPRYSSFATHANGPAHPVTYVDWYESWCVALWSGGRLPSDQEWEFSCRADTKTKFWSGDENTDLDRAGWYIKNSGSTTHVVGGKAANRWGLYDTHGNVWEWCQSWYDSGYWSRCVRGGSFYFNPVLCRSAFRFRYYPSISNFNLGVRVSRVAGD